MHLEIRFGATEDQKIRVAELFYDAHELNYDRVFGPKEKGIPIVVRHLRNDRVVVALCDGVVLGFMGLKFGGRGFIDVGFLQLLKELRLGVLKVAFGGCGYVVFRQLWMFLSRPREGEMLLEAIAVAANVRGKGIGSRLLDYLIDFAGSQGYRQLILWVVDTNVRARSLYRKTGFAEAAVRRVIFPWSRILSANKSIEMRYSVENTPKNY